ncbi:MAG: hypothetical protein A3F68_10355 [Acidobacteria bacterium RIFCSPLOWO2_12_FULL_54_10]|nr:MAG: hypothetical protein A3F68_10355 [Acidobacteria bacterium RIFCSPLOWO2_12_FULL_54_10]
MAIERWRHGLALHRQPFRELSRMEKEMEETFDHWFRGWPLHRREAETSGWAPAVDVVDRKDEVVLRADLPGLTEKDIDLTFEDGNLIIRGERKEEKETKEENFYCSERWFGSFSRTMPLPASVEAEKINATFKEGVLEVHIPKSKEAKGKKIEIKAA